MLDLGAGTGRVTRELAQRFEHVVAVEPDERMRALHGGAIEGSAEAIPLEDASVDAVFVGEAFHWFDPQAAIPELERVLRPRGGLAIVSTHWWETEPPLPDAALQVLSEPWERSQPLRRPPWDDAFDGSPFEQLRYERADDELTVDDETLLTLYSTTSSLAALPPEDWDRPSACTDWSVRHVAAHLAGMGPQFAGSIERGSGVTPVRPLTRLIAPK